MSLITRETLAFLADIGAHNDKTWFEANRARYEADWLAPARAFVAALGPRLREISPGVQFDPKVNGSISRINRDTRFSKDKRPYKDHLDLIFWHGERRGFEGPGFWFRLTAEVLSVGVGVYRFEGEHLEAYRQSVIHPRSGRELLAAIADLRSAGPYDIGEKSRKLLPRGYTTDADRVDYLLYEGLFAFADLPADLLLSVDAIDALTEHYRRLWPLGAWLMREIF